MLEILDLKVQINNRFLERNVKRIPETIQTGLPATVKQKAYNIAIILTNKIFGSIIKLII